MLLALFTGTVPVAAVEGVGGGQPAVWPGLLDKPGSFPGDRYWVEFSDRGCWERLAPEEIFAVALADGLTERALERRRIEGLWGDSLVTLADLPPDPGYIAALEALGARIRRVSRWLNMASVQAGPTVVELIRTQPFVKSVIPVARGMLAFSEYEVVDEWDGLPPPGPGVDLPGFYGPSYVQAMQVNAVEAHRRGFCGRGVLMVVLDTGFMRAHEALDNFDMYAEYDFVEEDDYTGYESEQDAQNQPNHGSACLSVIAGYSPGNLIGIAHGATFVLGKTEYVPDETIREEDNYVAALEWAERLGARVLSSSLGYADWYIARDYDGEIPLTSRASNRAFQLGLLSMTSSGNEGPQFMTLGAPSDSRGVIAVGRVDSTGVIARSSSRGPTADGRIKPELVALGSKTIVASPHTRHGYGRWNGTSLSCPIVAGVAALVRGAHPEWSAKKTVRALKATASRANRPDNIYGWGIPDAVAAIDWPEVRLVFSDRKGDPVPGIKVRMFKEGVLRGEEGGRTVLEEVSDAGGVVSFPNVPEGVWAYHITGVSTRSLLNGQPVGRFRCPDGEAVHVVLDR